MSPAAHRPLGERLDAATVVGRERETARLEQHLARGGRGARLLWLDGKAGIGKTTLLGEMAARARSSRGALSCTHRERGRCWIRWRRRERCSIAPRRGGGSRSGHRDAHERRARLPARRDRTRGRRRHVVERRRGAWVRASGEKGLPPLVLVDGSEQLSPGRGLLVRVLLHQDAGVWSRSGRLRTMRDD